MGQAWVEVLTRLGHHECHTRMHLEDVPAYLELAEGQLEFIWVLYSTGG